jgi:hypothetical protein
VAAIKELLDRGYGKAMQPIQGTVDYGISEQLAELLRGNEGNTLGAEIASRALPAPPRGRLRVRARDPRRLTHDRPSR